MKIAKQVSSIFLILIGVIHIGFSFVEFSTISADALWFVAGGLIFIFSGLFNRFLYTNSAMKLKGIFHLRIVNLLLTIFLIFTLFQLPMIPGFLGLACSVFLLFFNSINRT